MPCAPNQESRAPPCSGRCWCWPSSPSSHRGAHLALSFSQRSIQNDSRQQAAPPARRWTPLSSQLHEPGGGAVLGRLVPTTPEGIRVEVPRPRGWAAAPPSSPGRRRGSSPSPPPPATAARSRRWWAASPGGRRRRPAGHRPLRLCGLCGRPVGRQRPVSGVGGATWGRGRLGHVRTRASFSIRQPGPRPRRCPPVLAPGTVGPKGWATTARAGSRSTRRSPPPSPAHLPRRGGADPLPPGPAPPWGGQQWYQFEGSTSSVLTMRRGPGHLCIRVRQGKSSISARSTRRGRRRRAGLCPVGGRPGQAASFQQTSTALKTPTTRPSICGGAGTKVDLGGIQIDRQHLLHRRGGDRPRAELEYRPPIAGSTGGARRRGGGEQHLHRDGGQPLVAGQLHLHLRHPGNALRHGGAAGLSTGSQNRVVTYRAPIVKSGATGARAAPSAGRGAPVEREPRRPPPPPAQRPCRQGRPPCGWKPAAPGGDRRRGGALVPLRGRLAVGAPPSGWWGAATATSSSRRASCSATLSARPPRGTPRYSSSSRTAPPPGTRPPFETALQHRVEPSDNLNLYVLGGANPASPSGAGCRRRLCGPPAVQPGGHPVPLPLPPVGRPVAPSSGRWKLVRYEAA